MSTASPVEIFWNGDFVGSPLESEVETVGVPYERDPTAHFASVVYPKPKCMAAGRPLGGRRLT